MRRLANNPWIFWGATALFLIVLSYLFLGNEKDFKKELTINRTNSYMEGLKIVNEKDGVDSWVVSAKRAEFSKDETTAELDTVRIILVSKGVEANSDRGTYNLNTRDFRLSRKNNLVFIGKVNGAV